jgi:hypothetical protein
LFASLNWSTLLIAAKVQNFVDWFGLVWTNIRSKYAANRNSVQMMICVFVVFVVDFLLSLLVRWNDLKFARYCYASLDKMQASNLLLMFSRLKIQVSFSLCCALRLSVALTNFDARKPLKSQPVSHASNLQFAS